jgi:hypothetical protein
MTAAVGQVVFGWMQVYALRVNKTDIASTLCETACLNSQILPPCKKFHSLNSDACVLRSERNRKYFENL